MPILLAEPFQVFNKRFNLTIFACAFGCGFQHGYHTGIVSIPQEIIRAWISELTLSRDSLIPSEYWIDVMWSAIVAAFSVGGIIGGLLTYLVAEKLGRKGGMIFNNFILFLASILMCISYLLDTYELLAVGRFFVGINVGLSAGLAPMYLVEISPDYIRGSVATFYYFFMAVGILFANIVGFVLSYETKWPFVFLIPLLVMVLQVLSLLVCPESPKYLLISRDDTLGADRALVFLRQTEEIDVEYDLLELENSLQKEKSSMCRDHTLRHPLIICFMVMVGQQFSGASAMLYFVTNNLRYLEVSGNGPYYVSLGLATINLISAFFELSLIDLAGRRPLLMFSFIGMTVTWIILAIVLVFAYGSLHLVYSSVFLAIVLIAFYATGAGPIGWFCTPELFPHRSRALAATITVPVSFLVDFLISQVYLILFESILFYLCFIFFAVNLISSILVYLFVPEMKLKSAEYIIRYFE